MFESLHFRFHLSALNTAKRDQNIVFVYPQSPFWRKNGKKVYSSKSKFNYIKVEFKRGLNHMGISSYDFNITIEASWRQCQQCNLCVHRFLGLTSTKQGVNVTCSRPLRTAPGQGLN